MTENNLPTFEQEKTPDIPAYDQVVKELFTDQQIEELPLAEQGHVIVDRFIGAIVRRGGAEGSQTTYSPADILHLMDKISTDPDALKEITRTDGLRQAVGLLASDDRTGKMFGRFSEQLASDVDREGNETPTLTSVAQIEGYLTSGGQNNVENPVGGVHMSGDTWVPVILHEIERTQKNEYLSLPTKTELYDSMKPDVYPLMRLSARDLSMAYNSAQEVGVDVELLRRSTEEMKRRARIGHNIASSALFLATRGRVDDYATQQAGYAGRY